MQILIPAKSTSSRIPGKNMRPLGGKPLLWWTLEKCRRWLLGVPVWVATDDLGTIEYARSVLECRLFPLSEDDVNDRRNASELLIAFAAQFPPTERLLGMHVTSPFTLRSEVMDAASRQHPSIWSGITRILHRHGDLTLSQFITPTICMTGNLFGEMGQAALATEPPEVVPVSWLSALDINTPEDFQYADRLATRLGFDWLDDTQELLK